MELKKDCIREVLLYIEKNGKPNEYISNVEIKINSFSSDDITYTIEKLAEGNIINIVSKTFDGEILVKDITFVGHQFLENIRDDEVWKEAKTRISKIAGVSLSIIEQVTAQIIASKLGF